MSCVWHDIIEIVAAAARAYAMALAVRIESIRLLPIYKD